MSGEEKGNRMNSKDTTEVTLTVGNRAREQRKFQVTPRFLACVADTGERPGLGRRYRWTPASNPGNGLWRYLSDGCFYRGSM